MENVTIIPAEAYDLLAKEIDDAVEKAVSTDRDSAHVDTTVEVESANGETLYIGLEGEFFISVDDVSYPEGSVPTVTQVYPNWWRVGVSTDTEDLESTDFSINTLMDKLSYS